MKLGIFSDHKLCHERCTKLYLYIPVCLLGMQRIERVRTQQIYLISSVKRVSQECTCRIENAMRFSKTNIHA